MSIIKPQTLAHDQTILQHEGKYYAVISAVLGFSLKNPEKSLHESEFDPLWQELDMGTIPISESFAKQRAEVIVVGKIPAPKRHKRYNIRLQMNGIDKSLVAFSPRKWVPGPMGTFVIDWDDAAKAEPINLSWQNAWGGEHYPANIQGTGFAKGFIAGRSKLYDGLAVPPLEVVAPGIQSPGDKEIPPAGLSPIRMLDPRRYQYFGESADYWQKEGLPTLSKKFDFNFFQQAPLDQQRDDKFIPGEPYQLEIGDKVLAGILPTFKIRLLLADKKFERMFHKLDGDTIAQTVSDEEHDPLPEWFNEHSVEQPMEIDTLILIPEALKGIVIARSCFEVSNIHMSEWEHTLLVLEHPDQPKTLNDLQQALCDHLQEGALLKPSDYGLTPGAKIPKELRQKVKADKIFAQMHKGMKHKPSEIASQEVRIKANINSLAKAKDPHFIDYDFRAGELAGKKLQGLHLQNCTFTDIDFTETVFTDCSFLNCRFHNCIFYQSVLQNCDLVDCRFIAGDWRKSHIDNAKLQEVIFSKTLLTQATINNSHFINTQFSDIDAAASAWIKTQVVGGAWKHSDFTRSQFEGLRIQKLKISDSNLTKVKATKCMFNDKGMAFIRVNLSDSIWDAPNFLQSYWYKVAVENVSMPNGIWGFSKIIYTDFKDSHLPESHFVDSTFFNSKIIDSNLKNSVFEGALIKNSEIKQNNNLSNVNLKHVQFVEPQKQ